MRANKGENGATLVGSARIVESNHRVPGHRHDLEASPTPAAATTLLNLPAATAAIRPLP